MSTTRATKRLAVAASWVSKSGRRRLWTRPATSAARRAHVSARVRLRWRMSACSGGAVGKAVEPAAGVSASSSAAGSGASSAPACEGLRLSNRLFNAASDMASKRERGSAGWSPTARKITGSLRGAIFSS